jgi:hypothetical protein
MDRKQKIRRYKETPRPAGVYRVLRRSTGRMLLGASVDAPAMLNRIRAQLDLATQPNRQLQADWDVDGAGGFDFDVLDLLAPADDASRDVRADLEILLGLWTDRIESEGGLLY